MRKDKRPFYIGVIILALVFVALCVALARGAAQ